MTLAQVTKQVEKVELKVSKLRRELQKTDRTSVEKEWRRQTEILSHLESIKHLISL